MGNVNSHCCITCNLCSRSDYVSVLFVFPVSDCMNLFLFFVNECVFSHHNWSSGLSLSARSGTFVTAVYSKVVCIGVFLSFTCLRRVSCAVLLFIC